MSGHDELDRSGDRRSMSTPRRPSVGGSQMAVTAIDHGDRVVTVTSRLAEPLSSENSPQSMAFTTSVYGGPLNASMWRAKSSASLRNHAVAVNLARIPLPCSASQ